MGVNGKTHKGVCTLFRYTLLYVCIWKRGLDFVVSGGPRSRCFLYIQQKVKERLFATREMWKAVHFYRILARVSFWKIALFASGTVILKADQHFNYFK